MSPLSVIMHIRRFGASHSTIASSFEISFGSRVV